MADREELVKAGYVPLETNGNVRLLEPEPNCITGNQMAISAILALENADFNSQQQFIRNLAHFIRQQGGQKK